MKNKTLKKMLTAISITPVIAANRAAKARGLKLIDSLTEESVIIYGGMRDPGLEGYHKPTAFPHAAWLYHGKKFKAKVWRHDGADSWPVIVDVKVEIIDPNSKWSEVLVTTNEKQFRVMRNGAFFPHL